MEDKDFDRLFSDKIKRANAPDHSEADWTILAGRLDDFDHKRKKRRPVGWWLPIIAALLISNLCWWLIWRNSQEKISLLTTVLNQKNSQTQIVHDTIIYKTVVYHFDTIYQTVLYKNSFNNAYNDQNPIIRQFGERTQKAFANKNGNSNLIDSLNITPTYPLYTTLSPLSTSPLPDSLSNRYQPELPDLDLHTQPLLTDKIPFKHRLSHLKWGIEGGSVHTVAKNIAVSNGSVWGAACELPMNDHWGITLSGHYSAVKIKGYIYDETLGLPPLYLPGNEFAFKYFETHDGAIPIFDLGIGPRIRLTPRAKWSLLLDTRYTALWRLPFAIEMEYSNKNTGAEISEIKEIGFVSKPISMLDINLGLRYNLNRSVALIVGAYYQQKLNSNRQGIPAFSGLKASIFYQL